MSASFAVSQATERGWASNAHEAGVPSGGSLGRNLRSKTRWFTGFCNSHHVSHFATFFIDARAEISVAESHMFFVGLGNRHSPCAARRCLGFLVFLGVIPRRIPTSNQRARRTRGMRPVGPRRRHAPPRQHSVTCSTVVFSERQRQ